VISVVDQTQQRSAWPVRRILSSLEIAPARYYRWRKRISQNGVGAAGRRESMYVLLPAEREAICDYARAHPEVRHRELAWKMLDDGVGAVSPSSVYRTLREAHLVCRWNPKGRRKSPNRPPLPSKPDVLWQTDIRYTKVGQRNYYLLSFLDVYSRYVVHHELLRSMDGVSVSIAAAAALATRSSTTSDPGLIANSESDPLGNRCRLRPTIQSDHGSGFIAREFAETLAESGAGHSLIRPHTPTDNGIIERYHRTIGERIDEQELQDFNEAQRAIASIIDHYNHHRLHAALSYLPPVQYYRGNPEALLAERRRKLVTAREHRKQANLKLRQKLIPWPREKTITYPEAQTVSL
jgi:transposase InsO family protein